MAGFRSGVKIGVVVLAATLVPAAAAAQGKPSLVAVDPVIVEPLSQTMPVLGRFVARQTGAVSAQVGGPVAEVMVNVGDRVRAGDILVRLSTESTTSVRDLRAAQLRESEATLENAKAQAQLGELELRRLENLKKSAAFSQAQYDEKRTVLARLRASVAGAQAVIARTRANLDLAELDLRRAEIKAPYNGVVVHRHISAGAYVNPGAALVTLVNDEDLEIEADIPSDRLAGLAAGREVRVYLDESRDFLAVVRAIVPMESALTRTRPVRFTADFGDPVAMGLAADQSVTVMLPVGARRDVVTVHKDAVIARGANATVFVVEAGKAISRPVRLGEAVGDRFEVLDGLAPGDVVVVRGNERLRPDQPVSYDGMPPAPRGDG